MPKLPPEMRIILLIVAGAAVGVAAVFVIRGIADDGNGPSAREKEIRRVERLTAGAYDCMPRDVRRRFDATVKRYDAAFGDVIDSLPDDADPEEADRALRADPDVARLRTQARRILVDYAPGGDEFDAECYARATKRYDRRLARETNSP